MFNKGKLTVAMLTLGALAGWGAWNMTSKQTAQNVTTTAPTTATPTTTTPQSSPEGTTTTPGRSKVAHLIGQQAPLLNIRDKNLWTNTSIALDIDRFKGRVVLLEFFRINCSHCNTAAPYMVALNKKFGPQGLVMLGVQSPIQSEPYENDWRAVQDVVKNLWRIPFPVAFDEKAAVMSRYYRGDSMTMTWPTLLLIDRTGKIIYGHTGHRPETDAALYAAIQKELAKK